MTVKDKQITNLEELEIRKLNAKDVFTMTKIVSVIGSDIRKNLKEIKGDSNDEPSNQEIGVLIVESALGKADTHLKQLLMDVVGMREEEFDELPLHAPIYIIEKVAEENDLSGFLKSVRGLIPKLTGKSST